MDAMDRDHTMEIIRRVAIAFGAERAAIHTLPDWEAMSIRLHLGDRSTVVGITNAEVDALPTDLRVRDRVHERLLGALDELRERLQDERSARSGVWNEMPEARRVH